MSHHRIKIVIGFAVLIGLHHASPAQAQTCAGAPCKVKPTLYPVGWIPWLADLKSWRNYDSSTIAGAGRLAPSRDGQPWGEDLKEGGSCKKLEAGKYIFVMQWQNNETAADYIHNTDILYLKTQEGLGKDYIRHSQLASGFPVFCAGEFHINPNTGCGFWIDYVNNITEINNFSGHYKPACRCLGVLADKMRALGINTQNMQTKYMGNPEDCLP
jgi:hypothetical protein